MKPRMNGPPGCLWWGLAGVFGEEVRELLFEGADFGDVTDLDVRVLRVLHGVVLVVFFSAVEGYERDDLRDDGLVEDVGGVELVDVVLGDVALLVVGVEDGRAVAGADVCALAVELRGVVDDGEEDAQERAVGDDGGVEEDFESFGVAGVFSADGAVVGCFRGSSGVADGGAGYAFDALEDGLDAPEAASGEDCGFALSGVKAGLGSDDVVDGGGDGFFAG